jgi:hypothetical protein
MLSATAEPAHNRQMPTLTLLRAAEWRELEREHQERADAFSAAWRERQTTGTKHPVDDFLFTYYPVRPSKLRRWHPGVDVVLEGAAGDERAEWKWYRREGDDLVVDAAAYPQSNPASIRYNTSLLSATAARPAQLACFGLHEWAMVYKADENRHAVPLRLGRDATDAVVEANRISCTHFDAYRFFTDDAAPLNQLAPTRENQLSMDQPGCLHAGMDVYKWATKLGPLIPGDLLLDCFELARDIRQLDMRAAPYDLADWGYVPVAIETTEGRAEYSRAQRGFAERSNELRGRVVGAVGA